MRKTIFTIALFGLLAASAPAFAGTSGNGSNGAVGDNPNATATDDLCVRHNAFGNTTIVCTGERASTVQ